MSDRTTKNKLQVKGKVRLQVISPNGVTRTVTFKNLVGNYGTALMATLLSGGAGDQVDQIAVGTDATPETVTDTSLGVELYRKTASVELGTGPDANKVTFETTWAAGSAELWALSCCCPFSVLSVPA